MCLVNITCKEITFICLKDCLIAKNKSNIGMLTYNCQLTDLKKIFDYS